MSVHIRGIGPDGQWLTKAERNDMSLGVPVDCDPLARLEAWLDSGELRQWRAERIGGKYSVRLANFRRSLSAYEPTLAAAITVALDAWEAKP